VRIEWPASLGTLLSHVFVYYSLRPGKDAICGTEVKTATKQNYALYPYFLCLPLSAKRTMHEDQRFHSLPMGHAALAQAT
jgi:hypothetical protein